MISSSHSFQSVSIRKAILTLSILFVFSGCALVDNERNNQLSRNRGNSEKQVQNSTDYMLFPSDYVKFRSGRSKEEILKEINWKGDFIEASLYKGKSISAICFGLFESSLSREGELVWALFEDHKFKKFVRYPPSDGKLIKIGDHRKLIKAFESEPVTIAQLKKEMKENPPPSSTDWGLTIAWLLLRKGVVRGEKTSKIEMEKMFQKNIKLRDQFNAARLKIGLTEKEVEKVLKAKPIQNGKVEAGAFKIYGSTETLNVSDSYLYYTNILLVFEKGKVIGIYRIGGGERGIELSRQTVFSDLPPRK